MSFVLASPGDIAFKIFDFPIYYYGICLALAALVGFFVSYFVAKKYYKSINPDVLYDVVTFVIVVGFLSARFYYCILNYHYYINNPLEIFYFREGGLSIQGGIIGGFIFGAIYAKFLKLPILKLADIITFGLVIAQAIGRWGNFFNSEAYGTPVNSGIAVFIPEAKRILAYKSFEYFKPTFLYESILNLFIFGVLFVILHKFKNKFDGLIFALYVILYSLVRFFTEGIRVDSVVNFGSIHVAQIACILMFIIASIFLVYKSVKKSD